MVSAIFFRARAAGFGDSGGWPACYFDPWRSSGSTKT
jgi:hypothetical protein